MKNIYFRHFLLIVLIAFLLRPIPAIVSIFFEVLKPGYNTQFDTLRGLYEHSQYVQKINPSIIPDQTLELYAAGAFLRGLNPILIVHDQPPLGRYIMSASILLFDNATTIPYLLILSGILGIYFISRKVNTSPMMALIPVALVLNEPLFINALSSMPLLEPLQFPFIVWSIYFFMRGSETQARTFPWYIVTSILLGCVISIRFFVLGFVLFLSYFLFLLIHKKMYHAAVFILTIPCVLGVLFASYFRSLELGFTIRQILGFQKYMYVYHQSALIDFLSYWDLLMFNRWHTWWGSRAISYDQQWSILWPSSIVCIILMIIFNMSLLRKSKHALLILYWVICYSILLSMGYTSTRYFYPLLPFLYILAVYALPLKLR